MNSLFFNNKKHKSNMLTTIVLLLIINLSVSVHAQPSSDFSGIMKSINRWNTKLINRNLLMITQYFTIVGKPDSLIFSRSEGKDVLVFQWTSEGYQAFLKSAEQDSSFIIRFNRHQHVWHWGCKSQFEFPTAYHWSQIPGDSTSYILFTGPPRNGYERLLLLTFVGYSIRSEEVSLPIEANKNNKKLWGAFHSIVGKGQKNWYLNCDDFGKKMIIERLGGPLKFCGSVGIGAVGEMAVYRRR